MDDAAMAEQSPAPESAPAETSQAASAPTPDPIEEMASRKRKAAQGEC